MKSYLVEIKDYNNDVSRYIDVIADSKSSARRFAEKATKVRHKCTNTAELQEELGVSRRTLRTDIAYLKRVYPDKLITHRGRYTGGLEWVE